MLAGLRSSAARSVGARSAPLRRASASRAIFSRAAGLRGSVSLSLAARRRQVGKISRRLFASAASSGQFMDCVSAEWVAKNSPSVSIVNGTWVPGLSAGHHKKRIPTSSFFDIDAVKDTSSDLPHMLPAAADFGRMAGLLGLSEKDHIVVYDNNGMFSSPRVWWMLRTFGAQRVSVLRGGLPAWTAAGHPIAVGAVPEPFHTTFNAEFRPEFVATFDQVLANIDSGDAQVIDARSAGRFEGVEAEPRPGLKSGHVPGSLNVPFKGLLDDFSGDLKPVEALAYVFERGGVDISDKERPIITTCGSGVTASFLAYALHLLKFKNVAVYDGSWAEYGSKRSAPVETGPPKKK